MIRIPAMAVLLSGVVLTSAAADQSSTNKVLSTRDFGQIRREVETLRGKKFLRDVPVYQISEKELRAISNRELDQDYPGEKLHSYEELLAWLDVVPPHTDLKAVYADFMVDQVAGLYDSDTKEMCIPAFSTGATNAQKKADKKLDPVADAMDDIVLAHEFTHALEDQYWPIDVPADHDMKSSTDRGTAHDFVVEGSATRAMIEVIPDQMAGGSPRRYFLLWNALHSGMGELILNYELGHIWKSPDSLVEGVPDNVARTEAMPYSFGYVFCSGLMRDWGLDGLDYIYEHPPVSSAQVMHPTKSWQWRELPVRITVPEKLPGDWKQISSDCVGEAGVAVLFGCQFTNLNRGQEIGRGWDGDYVALYENTDKQRFFVWVSAWDSNYAADRYASAWLKERQMFHGAAVTKKEKSRIEWEGGGRAGLILRDGKRVMVFESNDREALRNVDECVREITFTEPPENAMRAAENSALRRYNPFVSWQKDGDYTVTRSLGGLLSRHDRNSVGGADTFLLGVLAETRRTESLSKWELGAGLLIKHDSEERRGISKTTLLPWGVLASHCSAKLPQAPDKTIMRESVLWGLCGSVAKDGAGRHTVHVLPFGLLFCSTTGPAVSSVHVLGTGVSHAKTKSDMEISRYRLFGIPLWTTQAPAKKRENAVAPARVRPG